MAKILNQSEILASAYATAKAYTEAKSKYGKEFAEKEMNDYINSAIHGASKKAVLKAVKDLIEETQTQANPQPSNKPQTPTTNTMAIEAKTKKEKAPALVLTPETNKAHRVIAAINKLEKIAFNSDYKGMDVVMKQDVSASGEKALDAKGEPVMISLQGQDLVDAQIRKFNTARFRFKLGKTYKDKKNKDAGTRPETFVDKPAADPAQPLHDKAIEYLETLSAMGVKALTANTEKVLDAILAIYAPLKKHNTTGRGKKQKVALESIELDF